MDETKYLKELDKHCQLSELLRSLNLPSEVFETAYNGCSREFLSGRPLDGMDFLLISKMDSVDLETEIQWTGTNYVLNDYMFIYGIEDPNQEKLQILFDFMNKHFDTYKDDCLKFLTKYQEAKLKQTDEKWKSQKSAINKKFKSEKETIISDINKQINCLENTK